MREAYRLYAKILLANSLFVSKGFEMARCFTFISASECIICSSGIFCVCSSCNKANQSFFKTICQAAFCDCGQEEDEPFFPGCCNFVSRNSCFWCCGGGLRFGMEILSKCNIRAKLFCLDCRLGICGCDPSIPAAVACCGMFCFGKPEPLEPPANDEVVA